MSQAIAVSILALATSALAAGHGHAHLHRRSGWGSWGSDSPEQQSWGPEHQPLSPSAPLSYGTANATGTWGSTGLGRPSGAVPTASAELTSSSSLRVATITVSPVGAKPVGPATESAPASYNAAVSGLAGASSYCACSAPDVTVTSVEQVTVTVTAGSSSSNAAAQQTSSTSRSQVTSTVHSTVTYYPSSLSSAEVSPIQGASTSAVASPVSSAKASPVESSSSSAIPTTYEQIHMPSILSAAPSSLVAPSSIAPASPSSAAVSSSWAAPSSGSSSTGSAIGSHKRGIAYNVTSDASCLIGKPQISWAYNWLSNSAGLGSGVTYIPMLHSDEPVFTQSWQSDAQKAIDAGAKYVFSMNEPDQDQIAAAVAASSYQAQIMPVANKNSGVKFCAPSVTNGGGESYGLQYLASFMSSCSSCKIDCINLHWYADVTGASDAFMNHLEQAIKQFPGKEIFVTEFGLNHASTSDIDSFLKSVMPKMDSNPAITGYSYFLAYGGYLLDGSQPNQAGDTYGSYTG